MHAYSAYNDSCVLIFLFLTTNRFGKRSPIYLSHNAPAEFFYPVSIFWNYPKPTRVEGEQSQLKDPSDFFA